MLDALLNKYADEGLTNLENPAVLNVQPFTQLGTPVELVNAFGGKAKYVAAIKQRTQRLYEPRPVVYR